MRRFQNRHEAGKELAQRLSKFIGQPNVIVLALPRGGVPVGYEVALALKAPLDIFIVRKLGLPGQEELAIGAIASGGVRILNEDIVQALKLDPAVIEFVTKRELEELRRREEQYRADRPVPIVRDRIVILVDDGLATGASMLAAVKGLHTLQPAKIIVAVPTAAPQAVDLLRSEVDEVIYVLAPEPFEGVGKWYKQFSQTTDDEVQFILDDANRRYHG